jgi:hypothetical protein
LELLVAAVLLLLLSNPVVFCCCCCCCCCCYIGVAAVAFVVVVFIREEEGLCSVAVALPVGNGIPLSHLHNVTRLSPSEAKSSIPASIIPFNGARIPVELVCNIAVTMPLPLPCGAAVGLLNCRTRAKE